MKTINLLLILLTLSCSSDRVVTSEHREKISEINQKRREYLEAQKTNLEQQVESKKSPTINGEVTQEEVTQKEVTQEEEISEVSTPKYYHVDMEIDLENQSEEILAKSSGVIKYEISIKEKILSATIINPDEIINFEGEEVSISKNFSNDDQLILSPQEGCIKDCRVLTSTVQDKTLTVTLSEDLSSIESINYFGLNSEIRPALACSEAPTQTESNFVTFDKIIIKEAPQQKDIEVELYLNSELVKVLSSHQYSTLRLCCT